MTKLIKFEKENCPACTMVENFLTEQNVEMSDLKKFQQKFEDFLNDENTKSVKINPFENPKLAAKFMISSVPVTILLDDEGNEIQRSRGFNPAELEEIITKL